MSRRGGARGAGTPAPRAGAHHTAPHAPLSSAAGPPPPVVLLAALGVAMVAILVFRGTLQVYFSQDDFAGLAHASGLLARHEGWWRWLSRQAYWSALWPVSGLDPRAYHALGLALHALNGLLLLHLLRARTGLAAAWIGAIFYVAHPSHFTSLYWASAAGDLLASTGVLAMLLLARRADVVRYAAIPAFVLALLAKEHVVLAPLVALLDRLWPASARRGRARRDPLALALVATMLLAATAIVTRDAFGVHAGGASDAYSIGLGRHLLDNLLSYAAWSVHIAVFSVHAFSDAVEPALWPLGALVLLALIGGGAVPSLRDRGWVAGAALFALTLLPMLPLRHHTYHYYLTLPLAGVAWCVAALADRALAPLAATRRGALARGAIAIVVATLLAVNGATLVRVIATHPFVDSMLADPVMDRARIARNVHDGLAGASLPPGVRLRIWMPRVFQPPTARGADPAGETYWESNLRSALLDGLAVRVMFPAIRDVGFVNHFEPAGDSVYYAVARIDGMVQVRSAPRLDAMLRASPGIR